MTLLKRSRGLQRIALAGITLLYDDNSRLRGNNDRLADCLYGLSDDDTLRYDGLADDMGLRYDMIAEDLGFNGYLRRALH